MVVRKKGGHLFLATASFNADARDSGRLLNGSFPTNNQAGNKRDV